MSYDTSKDPRLLVAQRACAVLRRSLQQKTAARPGLAKEKVASLAGSIESAVMTMLYLYQEPDQLAESTPMLEVVATTEALAAALQPVLAHRDTPAMQRATIRWCLRVLGGLDQRLCVPGTSLASGIDLQVVEVRNVTKIADKLWLTRTSDGSTDYTVVTNLPGIRPGDTLGVAFLPPREVGGEISEAMYLGSDRRSEPVGSVLAEDQVHSGEVTGLLHDELARR